MKRTLLAFVLGGVALCASTAALAHVDVGVSIGVPAPVYVAPAPVYAPPPPVIYQPAPVYAPAPVVVGGGYYRDPYWREREWRRREWREHEWREREWHHHRGWDRD
ncbi:putative signal peptide virulence protein Vrg-6 [Ralstonia solanacearum CMR15]|nr:putative signal peptide virulence protein Vrg-6 [Ralstonia solanacearum CMR15]